MRDSLFRTEVFDWPNGGEIRFYRGMFVSDTAAAQSGGDFWDASFNMTYQVDLVDITASATTSIETVIFKPIDGKLVIPSTVKLTNNHGTAHDVYLKVTATLNGVSTADSLTAFFDEESGSEYQSYRDTVVFKRADYDAPHY